MFDLSRYQDPLTIQRVIHNARTIAVVGLSKNELRASYFVGYYLKRHGYRVIPVNPREPEILGEKTFNRLADIPVHVDIVNVFRAPDALPGIAEEAVAIHAGSLWCQFTVINEEGARIAEAGGLSHVGPLGPTWQLRGLPGFLRAVGLPIDQVFARGDVVVHAARSLEPVGSDHLPVLVEFSLKAPLPDPETATAGLPAVIAARSGRL